MTTQLSIDDFPATIKTGNELTSRQWRLHELLLSHSHIGTLTNKDILEIMDSDYGYSNEIVDYPDRPFLNLSSRRDLSDDLDAITRSATIQHVYVGGKYATSEKEARKYILKQKIAALSALKKNYIQEGKLRLNGQQRLVFNQERDYWESILKQSEDELKEMGEREWNHK